MAVLAAVALTLVAMPRAVEAQEIYRPGIWIDPDGCEHWVMDDGAEGYMSPHRTRDGRPVCRRSEICLTMPTEAFFATDSYHLPHATQAQLRQFFQTAGAFAYLVYGHTDERASYEYNVRLSENRARTVARIGQQAGARIVDVKGFSELQPRAQGHNEQAWRPNRRVDIVCLR